MKTLIDVWKSAKTQFSEEDLFGLVNELLLPYKVEEVGPFRSWQKNPHSRFYKAICRPEAKIEYGEDDLKPHKKMVCPEYRLTVTYDEKMCSVDVEFCGFGICRGCSTGLKVKEDLDFLPAFLCLNNLVPRSYRQMSIWEALYADQ